jgi:hypothetical protein
MSRLRLAMCVQPDAGADASAECSTSASAGGDASANSLSYVPADIEVS